MTVGQAAKELGMPYQTLMSWIRKGKIVAVRKGWFWLISDKEIKRVRRGG